MLQRGMLHTVVNTKGTPIIISYGLVDGKQYIFT